MKILKLISAGLLILFFSWGALADECESLITPMGGYDAYPFGLEQPVPWVSINGTWMLENSRDLTRYVFKSETSESGAKRLALNVINARTCEYIGSGKGVENSRVVKGIYNEKNTSYLMTLHTFRLDDVKSCDPDLKLLRPRTTLTVLTLASVVKPNDRMSMRLIKVRDPNCPKF